MSKTRKPLRGPLRRVQGLIGAAMAAYGNDRAACRASAVMAPLNEAFAIMVDVNSRWPPERLSPTPDPQAAEPKGTP